MTTNGIDQGLQKGNELQYKGSVQGLQIILTKVVKETTLGIDQGNELHYTWDWPRLQMKVTNLVYMTTKR